MNKLIRRLPLLLLALPACADEEFPTPPVNLQAVHSSGAIGVECGETSPDTRFELGFTLTNFDQEQIFLGDRVEDLLVTTDALSTDSPNSIAIDSTATLFPAPDVFCDETAADGDPCPEASLAAAGFRCRPLNDIEFVSSQSCVSSDECTVAGHECSGGVCLPPVDRVCGLSDFALSVPAGAAVQYDGDASARRSIIVLFSNSASVLGITVDGIPSTQHCSTDPFDKRTRAASLMLGLLGNPGNESAASTELCVAAFDGRSEPDYRFETMPSDCLREVRDGTDGEDFLSDVIARLANSEVTSGRNPWAAVIDATSRFEEWNAAGERHIVLVTDGDTSEDVLETSIALQQTYARAVEDAVNAGVRVHVVQWGRSDRAEDCFPADTEGAVDEFSRLACATSGSYAFVERPDDLEWFAKSLGRSIPGRYSIPVEAAQLSALPLGPYKAEFTLTAAVDGNVLEFEVSARSGAGSTGREDTRIALVNRGLCADDAECHGDYVCDEVSATCRPARPE